MSAKRALYSLVQYVPDAGRAEAANAGVVLYVPETKQLVMQLSPTFARVKTFFKLNEAQHQRLKSAAKALDSRLVIARSEFSGEPDFTRFIAARADTLLLTPLRLMLVADVASELNDLYAELVGDQEAVPRTKRKPALPSRLGELFARLQREGKASRPHRIVVPHARKKFHVDATFDNGVRNYIRAEPLAEARLTELGFHGQLISAHPIDDRKGQLVIVAATAETDLRLETRFAETLADFKTRFVPFREADKFAEEVERDAH